MREVKAGRGEWGRLAVVKLRSKKNKEEVMRKNRGLKKRNIWIGVVP